MKPLLRAPVVAVAAMVATAALAAAPAGAHVTVNPGEAVKGDYAKLAFRTPNELDDASTVKVEVQFPTEHPFRSVSVRPTAGWEVTVERAPIDEPVAGERQGEDSEAITEAVSLVTWEGGSIAPGEFQEFEVSVGPLPEDTDELVFKVLQTYDSGEVVRWIEEPEPGETEEPERPAPVLTLVDPSGPGDDAGTDGTDAGSGSDDGESASSASEGEDDDDNDVTIVLAGAALAMAGVALVLSATGLVSRRRAARAEQ